MNVSYDYYKTFYYVAKHKSFTKAAEELFAEQPNVTRTIKTLEEQLGCILFFRSKRRVELTPEGEKLYRHVKIACEHIALAEEEISLEKNLHEGTVTIGTSETALYGLLLPVLKEFRAQYRGIRLKVGNFTTREALNALKNGFVDFAVVTSPLDTIEQMTVIRLKEFREIAICGKAFKELGQQTVSLDRLISYPVVGLGRSAKTFDFYNDLFAAHNLEYRADVEVATADQIVPMIANNLGVGFVPEFFLNGYDEVLKIDLAEEIPNRTICLVGKGDRPLSVAAKRLFEKIISFGENIL